MLIDTNKPEADTLADRLVRRRLTQTPLETASRLRAKYGIFLRPEAREPLPIAAFDDIWHD